MTKSLQKVQELGRYLLGYLQETWEFVLASKSCLADQGEPTDELMKLTLLSDALHAPQGLRGGRRSLEPKKKCSEQYGGCAHRSCGRSDDGRVASGHLEHLGAQCPDRGGQDEIRGDNLFGIQLLLAPGGPWRTAPGSHHLRLRSFVLRERLASREWHVEHVPGAELAADLLTKPVVLLASQQSCRRTLGLVKFGTPGEESRLCRLAEAAIALGGLVLQNGANHLVKIAGAVSLPALTAWMYCHEGLASIAKVGTKKNGESRPAQKHTKRSRKMNRTQLAPVTTQSNGGPLE